MAGRQNFRVTVNPQGLKRVISTFQGAPEHLHRQLEYAFQSWGDDWHGAMMRQFRPAGGGNSKRLSNRTGALRRSLQTRTTGKQLGDLTMRAFSAGVPYANLQEFGGTVTSNRPGGYLTIPLPALRTAAGVTREPSARDMIRRKGLGGQPGNLTFWRSKKGNLLLGEVQEDGSLEPLWVLKRKVRIPAGRLGFFRTWRKLRGDRDAQLARAVARAVKSAAGGA